MTAAVIVAAGKGTRMGGGGNKLLLPVAGKALLVHAWEKLDQSSQVQEIVWVAGDEVSGALSELASRYGLRKKVRVVPGGAERQDSVWNGLQAVASGTELVLVHDAARPCLRAELIDQCVASARQTGAAVAAQRVTDTIKESTDGRMISRHLDRSRIWAVQTPQAFRVEVLRKALEAVRARGLVITDDTAACELIEQPVALVEWPHPNPKLTHPGDIPYLEQLLGAPNGGR